MSSKRGLPTRQFLSPINLRLRGIPSEYKDCNIDDYVQDDDTKEVICRYIDNIHDMYEDRACLMFYGANGTGKAQPLYSNILTEHGWREMGDIKVGDKVYNRLGKLSSVLAIFPQGKKRNFRVTFLDGRTAECCDEHLWTCYTSRGNFKTVTLYKMMETGFRTCKDREYRYFIPNNECIQFKKANLPIDPYVLGVMIGDGSIAPSQLSTSVSSAEEDVIQRLRDKLGNEYKVTKYNTTNYSWGISYLTKYNSNPLKNKLANLGLRCKSIDKFIPSIYLFSSTEQRMELLRGLFDTDGSVSRKGNFSFSTHSRVLYLNFMHLCRSLGMQCIGKEFDRGDKGIDFDVKILTDKEIFTSKKHKDKWHNVLSKKRGKNVSRYYKTAIVSAEYIGETDMQCIVVDDVEHLYITDDFTVTHNTLLASIIVKEAYRHRYNSMIITMSKLMDITFKSNKSPEDYRKMQEVRDVDFLVVDEVGKENFTATRSNVNLLEETLRQAIVNGQVVILCTNLPLDDKKGVEGLYTQYGKSIMSLVDGGFVKIEFDNDDFRRNVLTEKRAIRILKGEKL